jgi:hypothetical protein
MSIPMMIPKRVLIQAQSVMPKEMEEMVILKITKIVRVMSQIEEVVETGDLLWKIVMSPGFGMFG